MNQDRANTARELLAFYKEAGVDWAIGEETNDFLTETTLPPPERGSIGGPPAAVLDVKNADAKHRLRHEASRVGVFETPRVPSPDRLRRSDPPLSGKFAAPLSPDAAVMAAREAARSAATLDELRGILERFDGCALKATATQLVFADGNSRARIMLVGEAPGYEEDRQGLPFVGRSGKLLDCMLAAIGLDRTQVYIANIVPWRPPGNRTPTPQEAAICLPFLLRQIALCDPDVLVCLGGPSAQTLLGVKDGILKIRGRWFTFQSATREIRAMPTLHPAYLLRSPIAKRQAWRDFLAIKKALTA